MSDATPSWLTRAYLAGFAGWFAIVLALGLVWALAFPYHEWDAFAFSELSRAISRGDYDISDFPAAYVNRPLFYVAQGGVWSVFGFSFSAGRLLGLAFFALLVVASAGLAGRGKLRSLEAALAGLVILSIPAVLANAVAGLTDVPAAAMVAASSALALRTEGGRRRAVVLGTVVFLTVLTKPSVLGPVIVLLIILVLRRGSGSWRRRAGCVPPWVGAATGLVAGLGVHALAAAWLDVGPADYLTNGTGGLWAQRAAAERWDALARFDVLGAALRLPLAFALLYAAGRGAGLRHRLAGPVALAGAVVWFVVGGMVGDTPDRDLWAAETLFASAGFLALLALFCACDDRDAPERRSLVELAALAIVPLGVWWYATPYADRLASTSWPAAAALLAVVVAVPLRRLATSAGVAALAPAIVLLVPLWVAMSGFDGFGSPHWRETRSLGWGGLWNEDRTLNIVLPSVQSSVAVVRPLLADGGILVTPDPRFVYWFADQTRTDYAFTCDQLGGTAAYILVTSDEARSYMESRGSTADPAFWASCTTPKLEQLTDGSNGFAVFAVKD
ncbi:MAG: hypothetical protein U0R50_14690 [Gaiellales bacterium]